MKIITKYQCELCGEIFKTEHEARSCENEHLNPMFIKGAYFKKSRPFPEYVDIEFKDGIVIRYENAT